MRKLERKLEENKIKEEKETQDLEAMVQHVEQNLQLMTVSGGIGHSSRTLFTLGNLQFRFCSFLSQESKGSWSDCFTHVSTKQLWHGAVFFSYSKPRSQSRTPFVAWDKGDLCRNTIFCIHKHLQLLFCCLLLTLRAVFPAFLFWLDFPLVQEKEKMVGSNRLH